jgi:hypothetical protein
MTAVHHYEQIIQTHQTVIDGYGQRIIPEKTLVVDHTTYLTLADYERKIVTVFEYETQKNDNNRHIYLLDPNFLGVIKEQHPFVFDKGINLR